MRTQVRRQELESGEIVWRITEADGRAACRWLPLEPVIGALDRGGFGNSRDASSFALGVDLVRAEAGLLELTVDHRGPRSPDLPLFEVA
jgi:hypothetical protein